MDQRARLLRLNRPVAQRHDGADQGSGSNAIRALETEIEVWAAEIGIALGAE